MRSRSPLTGKDGSAFTPGQRLGELVLWLVRPLLWVGFTAAGTALNMWAAVLLLLLLAPVNIWGYLAAGFGAALAGGAGGAVTGLGQVLALRRWLDGAASLGSFLSTVLASSSALAAGTLAGWWVHTLASDLAGILSGVVVYGCVFGLVQRPMLDYMAPRSILWVPANVVASVLGAVALLAAYDLSGGRRDMLQFRYGGIVYALVVGAAFLWMTRETRRAMAAEGRNREGVIDGSGAPAGPVKSARHEVPETALLEIHEHRVYKVYQTSHDPAADQSDDAQDPQSLPGRTEAGTQDGEKGPGVIDGSYRVIS